MNKLLKLPIGIQTFEKLREEGYLYVDKTKYLVELIDKGKFYFLSRPRRFGKSLTISTFDALFSGKREFFKGLHAEEFFGRPEYKTHPVIRLDMSIVTTNEGSGVLRASMLRQIKENAKRLEVDVEDISSGDAFAGLMRRSAEKHETPAVVLVDEYDSPILNSLRHPERIQEIREALHDLYIQIKAADASLRFVFITGITKFSKMGIFSALNSLKDISMKDEYATMLGYTESELLSYFDGYIDQAAARLGQSKEETIFRIRDYYDGFSFDGKSRLYNPFSTLNFFDDAKFRNYWFESGTPSFLAQYVKQHDLEVENFRGLKVGEDFTSTAEIELAEPESFLFQSGYLTARESDGENFILDYPNKEVLSSVARLFLYGKLGVGGFTSHVNDLERALAAGDAEKLIETYDRLLTAIPYDLYAHEERKYGEEEAGLRQSYKKYPSAESFYHSLLFAVMWGARVNTVAERHSYRGRSDIEAEKNGRRYIVELKIAEGGEASEKAAEAAIAQARERDYADQYAGEDVTLIGLAVDRGARRVGGRRVEKLT